MPNFDTPAALNAAKTFLEGRGLTVNIGVPENFPAGVCAYIADGPRTIRDIATNDLIEQQQRVFVAIGYRVQGAESNIELALAAMIDDIVRQWTLDRRANTGFFTVAPATLDFSIQNDPRYQTLAGQEFRIYPFLIVYSQREVIT